MKITRSRKQQPPSKKYPPKRRTLHEQASGR